MNVNWDDEIPNIWEHKKMSKPPTRYGYTPRFHHPFWIAIFPHKKKKNILDWDFPEQRPSLSWGTPIFGNPPQRQPGLLARADAGVEDDDVLGDWDAVRLAKFGYGKFP